MRVLRAALRVARGLWLTVGAALALLLFLECAYRAQAGVRAAMRSDTGAAAAGTAHEAILAEGIASARYAWHPFVYYRRGPFNGRYVHVDSLGRRATVPATSPGTHREVLVFGGSPLWGAGLPDSLTIPSLLSRALAGRVSPELAVVNYGESGWTMAQELVELVVRLRAGDRPAAVIFYDGFNDIDAALDGHPGETKDEPRRARDFALGRGLFPWQSGLATDLAVLGWVGRAGAGRFQLLQRLRPAPPAPPRPEAAVAPPVVRSYRGTIEQVEALSRYFGFEALYLWMPMVDPGEKPLTPSEREVAADVEANERSRMRLAVDRLVRAALADAHTLPPGARFADFSPLFRDDTSTVFMDPLAHLSEHGAAVIARRMAELVGAGLAGRASRGAAPDRFRP